MGIKRDRWARGETKMRDVKREQERKPAKSIQEEEDRERERERNECVLD